jgi:hypothetical protein
VLGLVFFAVGLSLVIGGVAAGEPVVWGVGLLVAAMGLAIATNSLFIRREQRIGLEGLRPLGPGRHPAPGGLARPWPLTAVAAELQRVPQPGDHRAGQ